MWAAQRWSGSNRLRRPLAYTWGPPCHGSCDLSPYVGAGLSACALSATPPGTGRRDDAIPATLISVLSDSTADRCGRAVGTAMQVPKTKEHDHLSGEKISCSATALQASAEPLWVDEGAGEALGTLAEGSHAGWRCAVCRAGAGTGAER